MSKTLREIVETAAEAYPDHFLQRKLAEREDEGGPGESLTVALADYIVREMQDLYDAGSGDLANLERIISSLRRSVEQLDEVIERLEDLADDLDS